MAEQPSKRQRISPDRYVATGSIENEHDGLQANPTTPTRKRASYLSPTKASLARSNPNVLAKSPRRSMTEPRGRILREQLLGRKPVTETESSNGPQTISKPLRNPGQKHGFQDRMLERPAQSDQDDFVAAITKTFAGLPVEIQQSQHEYPTSPVRTPLRARQPSNISNASRSQTENESNVPEFFKPRLVPKSSNNTAASKPPSNELDLPPTPVQLGLDRAPDRPRGLMSSSSAGSKSGSGKRRHRVRPGMNAVTSSPLKPKDHRTIHEVPIPQEALESDVDASENEVDDMPQATAQIDEALNSQMAGEVEERRTDLSTLYKQLDRLKNELRSVQAISDRLENDNDSFSIDNTEKELLIPEYITGSFSASSVQSSNQADEETSAHRTLFAPGGLQLSHTTITRRKRNAPKLVQKLTVTAPAPWPSNSFQMSFQAVIDVNRTAVESVTQAKPGHFYKHAALQTWIESRLKHSFHNRDIGGLIRGSGHYFESCITRAKVFKRLSERYDHGTPNANEELRSDNITSRDALILCHFLDVDQISFTLPTNANTEHSDQILSRRILLAYELGLTWTGSVRSVVEISMTGLNTKAQQCARELFNKLLLSHGVEHAFDGVWSLLDPGSHQGESAIATAKGRKAKRRMVFA